MIACLGWGSLVWNHDEGLPVEGGWHTDGPQLPVEFTRVSSGERLTLVVTEGAPPVTILWAALAVSSLGDAMNALAKRVISGDTILISPPQYLLHISDICSDIWGHNTYIP